jgi:hypothetical protein
MTDIKKYMPGSTEIRDLLDKTIVPYAKQLMVEEEISKIIRKIIFEDMCLKDTMWNPRSSSLTYHKFDVFGEYNVQVGVIEALRRFGSIAIYDHAKWKDGHDRTTMLTILSEWPMDDSLMIRFPTFATIEEIKEVVNAAGIKVYADIFDPEIEKARMEYERLIKEKEKWNW